MKTIKDISAKLIEKGLRVTPQRLFILEAIYNLNHPVADDIIKYIKKNHPNIATGTVYKVLARFVESGLIKKIYTENDIVHYDSLTEIHHHLYKSDKQIIEDYIDKDLDDILRRYFEIHKIKDFEIKEISLQIKGDYKK